MNYDRDVDDQILLAQGGVTDCDPQMTLVHGGINGDGAIDKNDTQIVQMPEHQRRVDRQRFGEDTRFTQHEQHVDGPEQHNGLRISRR